MRPLRVLFEPYLIYHMPQFQPLADLMLGDERYDVRFSSSGHSEEERRHSLRCLVDAGCRVIGGATDGERYATIDKFDPDVVIVGWGRRGYMHHVRDPGRPVFVMIYHGIGVKASYYHDAHPRIDFRAVESPYRVAQLRDHRVPAEPLLTGCVKLDPLYGVPPYSRDDTLASLGLPPDRPTVLYAPTYYPSSIGTLRERIGTDTQGLNCIVKLHNYTRHHPDYQDDHRVMQQTAEQFAHVRLVSDDWLNILPLYHAADVLLTDASSVMFEYLALDRPVVVCTRHRLYLRHRLFPWFYVRNRIDTRTLAHRDFYDTVDRPDRLRPVLDRVLAEPGRLAPQRRVAHDTMLHFRDGCSARRLLEHIDRIAAERGLCTH